MDFKELLKKYWFILIVGLLLIILVIGIGINDAGKPQEKEELISNKELDGKYILFSFDDEKEPYLADDYFNKYDNDNISSLLLSKLLSKIANIQIKTTHEIKTLAANQAQYYIYNYSEDELNELMRTNGLIEYGDITTYFEEQFRQQELIKEYFKTHKEDKLIKYKEDNKLKKISHILIKVADVKQETDDEGNTIYTPNPTDEESNKLREVQDRLVNEEFGIVAKDLSEDGSSETNGILGIYTDEESSSKFVKPFASAVESLEYGGQSEVVVSEYGYHIIRVDEPTEEDLLQNIETLINIINADSAKEYFNLLVEYSNKLDIRITNDSFREFLNTNSDLSLNDIDGNPVVKEELEDSETDIEESEDIEK